MLKKVEQTGHETAASKSTVKDVRASLLRYSNYPQAQIDIILPKKAKVVSYKLKTNDERKAQHLVVDKESHFIYFEDYCIPVLRTVHAYPDLYPRFTADLGALKFILKGANVMCPGLTNENASMDEVEEGAVVAIYVKDHEHCLGLGIAKMSTKDIRTLNQGIAVQTVHYVGDSFWQLLYGK